MISPRDQGKVEILMPCQTYDPAKGSFMVNAKMVKDKAGNPKMVNNPFYNPYDFHDEKFLQVWRAAHHKVSTHKGTSYEQHPDAFEYAVHY